LGVLTLALVMLPGMVWGAEEKPSSSGVAALDLKATELSVTGNSDNSSPTESTLPVRGETCGFENTAALSLVDLTLPDTELLPFTIAPRTTHIIFDGMEGAVMRVSSKDVNLTAFARKKMLPEFAAGYRALLKRVAMIGLPRNKDAAWRANTIIGTVSTYNPYREGRQEGGPETASGEPYDPSGWTAAIKTGLRKQFGGVRYGKLYQPTFALVQSGTKQLIVKINDVGPLRPGRVLDLNERSMRHFDPFLTRGLLKEATITLLPGNDWTPGPVGVAYAIDLVRAEPRPMIAELGPDTTTLPADSELARWRAPLGHAASTIATSSHAAVAAIR